MLSPCGTGSLDRQTSGTQHNQIKKAKGNVLKEMTVRNWVSMVSREHLNYYIFKNMQNKVWGHQWSFLSSVTMSSLVVHGAMNPLTSAEDIHSGQCFRWIGMQRCRIQELQNFTPQGICSCSRHVLGLFTVLHQSVIPLRLHTAQASKRVHAHSKLAPGS